YYFFDSKADLAAVALEEDWEKRRPELDSLFSPTIPPLERLRKYCDFGYCIQKEIQAKCGCVLGCPLFTLGAEVSTQENKLQRLVQNILEQKRRYLESTIRDAHAAGLIEAPDAAAKARTLFAYFQGLLTQARIENNLELLRDSLRGAFE